MSERADRRERSVNERMTVDRPRVTRKQRITAEGLHVDLFHVKLRLEELSAVIRALGNLQMHQLAKWTPEEVTAHEADVQKWESFSSSPPDVNALEGGLDET